MRILNALWIAVVIGCFLLPSVARAYDPAFNYNFIVADDDLLDYESLSQAKIQEFLTLHGSQLADLTFSVTDPNTAQVVAKPASQLIYEASQNYKINPKVILVTLQKEESLIDDDGISNYQTHLDWAMGYGVCDSCSTDDPSIQGFKGFANQVDVATKAFRRYYDSISATGHTVSGWGPGIVKQLFCSDYEATTDGFCPNTSTPVNVAPANFVTSALYTYTPHFHGNYNFWKIWNRFAFNLRRLYPDGTLLKAQGTSTIYLIQNGLKRKFAKMSVFLSRYNSNSVITVPADHLLEYDNGRDILFANYSLLKTPNRGINLLVDDVLRPIASRAAFQAAGFLKEEVTKVSWDDVASFAVGDKITTDNIFPSGRLMQNKKTGGIYFVKDGIKHPVYSKYIKKDQFGLQKANKVSPVQLATYTDGPPVGFRDGDLIQATGDSTVYVISNGYRLPIASPTAFAAYRFTFSNVLKVDNNSLWVHPLGPTLDVDSTVQTASR